MTREEAIDIIKKYDVNGCGYCHQGGNEVEEAFNMAIKALEYDDAKYHKEHGEVIVDKAVWEDAEKALQEPKYCDRNVCLRNEYSGIGCDECEVTKSQEPCGDLISRRAVLNTEYQIKEINGIEYVMLSEVQMKMRKLPSVNPQEPSITWVTGADGAKIAFWDVPVWKVTKICEILGEPQEGSEE